jgi:spore germination cell wall hydrolase CwlJ-like protein
MHQPSGIAITKIILLFLLVNLVVLLFSWGVNYRLIKSLQTVDTTYKVASERQRELECLAKNIYYEAGNEPFEGKVAVAQVTLNRVEHRDFPEDVCRVVYQKNIFYEKTVCQFSWYCDRKSILRPIDKESFNESMIVAKKVLLEGFRLPSLHQALFYHADYINPGWRKPKIIKIGRHIFYASNKK